MGPKRVSRKTCWMWWCLKDQPDLSRRKREVEKRVEDAAGDI